MEIEQLGRGQPSVEPEVLRKEPDLPADIYIARGHAENKRLAIAGFHQPEEHLDRSTFPGSIRTEKAEDFAPVHSQRKIPYGDLISKYFAQVLRLNGKALWLIQVRLPASIERIRQRQGRARVSPASETIDHAIFHPNQHVARSAAARFVDQCALCTVHFHHAVRVNEARNWKD
jgi:hypothetical protein